MTESEHPWPCNLFYDGGQRLKMPCTCPQPTESEPVDQELIAAYEDQRIEDAQLTENEGREQGEKCQACGTRYLDVYWLPDDLWERATGITDGSGLRCPSCIVAALTIPPQSTESVPNKSHPLYAPEVENTLSRAQPTDTRDISVGPDLKKFRGDP